MNISNQRILKVFKDHLFLCLFAIFPAVILFLISRIVESNKGIILSYLLIIIPVIYLTLFFMRIRRRNIAYKVGFLTKISKSLYYLNSKERLITLEPFDEFNGKEVQVWYVKGLNIILEISLSENR